MSNLLVLFMKAIGIGCAQQKVSKIGRVARDASLTSGTRCVARGTRSKMPRVVVKPAVTLDSVLYNRVTLADTDATEHSKTKLYILTDFFDCHLLKKGRPLWIKQISRR